MLYNVKSFVSSGYNPAIELFGCDNIVLQSMAIESMSLTVIYFEKVYMEKYIQHLIPPIKSTKTKNLTDFNRHL